MIGPANATQQQCNRSQISPEIQGSRAQSFKSGISLASSQSVYGPWTVSPVSFVGTGFEKCGFSNPSVTSYSGGVMMAFTFGCGSGQERIGVAQADNFTGPFQIIRFAADLLACSPHVCTPSSPDGILPRPTLCLSGAWYEDPFIWHNARGFHLLSHGMCPTGVLNSKYAFSVDGKTWTLSRKEPYDYVAEWAEGGRELLSRRERPQLVFDSTDGRPLALFTGALPLLATESGRSFTLMSPIGAHSEH